MKRDLHFVKQTLNFIEVDFHFMKDGFNFQNRPSAAGAKAPSTVTDYEKPSRKLPENSEYSGFMPGLAASPDKKMKRWLHKVKGLFNKMKVCFNILNGITGDGIRNGPRTAWVARRAR